MGRTIATSVVVLLIATAPSWADDSMADVCARAASPDGLVLYGYRLGAKLSDIKEGSVRIAESTTRGAISEEYEIRDSRQLFLNGIKLNTLVCGQGDRLIVSVRGGNGYPGTPRIIAYWEASERSRLESSGASDIVIARTEGQITLKGIKTRRSFPKDADALSLVGNCRVESKSGNQYCATTSWSLEATRSFE